ncbi:hypothetical protein PSTT_06258 [Puccinia striiformis]|uniref:Uncharacterized protein n=1 Tax=Puccinia striiformis TaxID=27350 RepID=A0A2S4VLA9_9BASI|nr:hypothetical protein PSTT_06258 [Puccinia striiformis]
MEAVTVFFGTLSFLFLLTSTVLMIASNCTVPTSDEIYFLRTTMSAALTREVLNLIPPSVAVFDRITVRMGLLGYCINDTCTQYHLGYRLPAMLMGGPVGLDFLNRENNSTGDQPNIHRIQCSLPSRFSPVDSHEHAIGRLHPTHSQHSPRPYLSDNRFQYLRPSILARAMNLAQAREKEAVTLDPE